MYESVAYTTRSVNLQQKTVSADSPASMRVEVDMKTTTQSRSQPLHPALATSIASSPTKYCHHLHVRISCSVKPD